MSGVILLIGALAIAGPGLKFGIDFESGTRIKTRSSARIGRTRSEKPSRRSATATPRSRRSTSPAGRHGFQIDPTLEPEEVREVRNALDSGSGWPRADFTASSIGPTFGAQIANTAVIAILASLLLDLDLHHAHSRPVRPCRCSIALAHDILITAGVYSIFGRR